MRDEELLAMITAKKQQGLIDLLDKYGGLMKHIVKNTGNFTEEDIAECMSDILYTVWKRANKYDKAKASFKTWVIIVTRGCAVDFLRKNIKHGSAVSLEDIGEVSVTDDFTGLTENSVISLLQELMPPDNEIFYRRFVLGESVNEIAEISGLTGENVYKRLSRGREKLKSLMSREGYGDA